MAINDNKQKIVNMFMHIGDCKIVIIKTASMQPPSIQNIVDFSNKIQAKCIYKTAIQIVDNVIYT